MSKFINKIFFSFVLFVLMISPFFMVSAQETECKDDKGNSIACEPCVNSTDSTGRIIYCPLAPLPIEGNTGADLSIYISGLFNFIIGLAAILAVFMIALGGFTYITTDTISGKSDGKGFISNAVWGLILALAAWLILNTINPNLLNFNLNNLGERPVGEEGGSVDDDDIRECPPYCE